MQQPLISIIIPVYKVESYLKRCIDSVLKQTYTNLEIILIDDGSPDNCPAICDDFANKDSRIKVIHQKNQGLSAARNAGLDICKGKFISFIDSDDWVSPLYITTLLDGIEKTNAEISIVDIRKTLTDTLPFEVSSKRPITLTTQETILRLFSKTEASFIAAWGKLFKRDVFENLRFPIGKIHEDEYVNYQWYDKVSKIAYINTPLYYYFCRPNSITGAKLKYNDSEIYQQQYTFFFKKKNLQVLKILAIRRCWQLLGFYLEETLAKDNTKQEFLHNELQHVSFSILPIFPLIFSLPFLAIFKKKPTLYVAYKKLVSHF